MLRKDLNVVFLATNKDHLDKEDTVKKHANTLLVLVVLMLAVYAIPVSAQQFPDVLRQLFNQVPTTGYQQGYSGGATSSVSEKWFFVLYRIPGQLPGQGPEELPVQFGPFISSTDCLQYRDRVMPKFPGVVSLPCWFGGY